MHDSHPIAYLSRALSNKHQYLSAYEKEFLAVVMAVEKWRPYVDIKITVSAQSQPCSIVRRVRVVPSEMIVLNLTT